MARPENDQEKQPEPLPISPPRLGKEAKIGVVVILLGLVGLGVGAVLRFTRSTPEEPAASADALFGDLQTKPPEPPRTSGGDRKSSESKQASDRAPELGVPPLTPPKTAVRSRYADIPAAPPAPPKPPVTTPVEEKKTPIAHNAPLPPLVDPPAAQPERKASRYERSTPPTTPPTPPPASPPKTASRFDDRKTDSRYDPPPARPSYRPGRVYIVKPGETIFDIARTQLGKATRWVEIYDLNRSTLGKELETLQPGMKLTLPAGGS